MPGVAAGAGLLDPFSDPVAGVAAAPSAAGCGIGKAGSSLILKGASKLKGSASAATSYGQKVFRVVRTNVTVNTVTGAIGGVRGITPEMYLQTLPLARTLLGSQTISRPLRMRSLKGL